MCFYQIGGAHSWVFPRRLCTRHLTIVTTPRLFIRFHIAGRLLNTRSASNKTRRPLVHRPGSLGPKDFILFAFQTFRQRFLQTTGDFSPRGRAERVHTLGCSYSIPIKIPTIKKKGKCIYQWMNDWFKSRINVGMMVHPTGSKLSSLEFTVGRTGGTDRV